MGASDGLAGKLSEWLKKGGYPFEMKVARAFKKFHFSVGQSEYYADLDTNVSREIDVTALTQLNTDRAILRVEFVIECKTSVDKPWVMRRLPSEITFSIG